MGAVFHNVLGNLAITTCRDNAFQNNSFSRRPFDEATVSLLLSNIPNAVSIHKQAHAYTPVSNATFL